MSLYIPKIFSFIEVEKYEENIKIAEQTSVKY